jgi:hypothetical protein
MSILGEPRIVLGTPASIAHAFIDVATEGKTFRSSL